MEKLHLAIIWQDDRQGLKLGLKLELCSLINEL